MSTQNVDLLGVLLLPVLILLGIGIVVLVVWLIWSATRTQKGRATGDTVNRSALESARPSDSIVSLRRQNQEEWEIRIDGQSYATLKAVPNPKARAEVLSALRALATFAGYPSQPSAAPLSPRGRVGVGAQSTAARQQTDARPTSQTERFPSPADQARASAERDRLLVGTTATTPQGRRGASEATLPVIDLAREIGEVLDEMLRDRPSLRGHAVTLQNRPGRGIAFVVDGTTYHEITDIPNPEVQALIRDATKEWERR